MPLSSSLWLSLSLSFAVIVAVLIVVIIIIEITAHSWNKRNLVTTKVDTISTRRKRQRDVGRQEAMEYFDKESNKELTWPALIFDDEKVGCEYKNETSIRDS